MYSLLQLREGANTISLTRAFPGFALPFTLPFTQAHKQMVKLEFKRRNYDEMISIYKEMLTYIKSAVTRNYSEKVINKVLDLVSAPGGMEEGRQMELLHDFYETTLSALQEARNDRLWFKTNLKLGKLWFDREEYPRLLKILKE